MKMKFIILFIILSGCRYCSAQQDPMFTRYMFISDMMYNPASAAHTGDSRLLLFYRNQWVGLKGAPETMGISYELPLESLKSGLGINVFRDIIGFESNTAFYANYAYKIPLTDKYTISCGIKGGVSIFRNDFSEAVTPGPINLDPVYNGANQILVPRVGAGIFISSTRSYLGFSVPNVSAFVPKGGFIFAEDDAYLSRHYYFTSGYVFDIKGTDLQVKPSLFVKYHQSAPLQLDLAGQLWYKDLFSFGLSYRTGDAIGAIVDISLSQDLVISYGYDYTYSAFRTIGRGAHEVILTYQWKKKNVKIPSIHKFSTLPRF